MKSLVLTPVFFAVLKSVSVRTIITILFSENWGSQLYLGASSACSVFSVHVHEKRGDKGASGGTEKGPRGPTRAGSTREAAGALGSQVLVLS